jgi:uncharacterized membrane protein (UPF0182 family)
MAHLRYPQDLFKVQRQLLTRYHVTKAAQFYSGSEVWQVPDDPASKSGKAVPPYYLSMKMPDQTNQSFSLTTTFTPNKRSNLSAFMAVDANANSPDYGKMRVLKLPLNAQVDGPQQVQSKFNSEPQFAPTITLLKGKDSTIEYGNLLTMPLDGGLLYVEPVYVRGADTDYPLLKKVFVNFGGKMAFEDTLGKALDVVFGNGTSPPPSDTGGSTTKPPPTTTVNPTLQQALADAQKAYDDGQAALKASDWVKYGEAQKRLADALKQAQDAEKGTSKGAKTG